MFDLYLVIIFQHKTRRRECVNYSDQVKNVTCLSKMLTRKEPRKIKSKTH